MNISAKIFNQKIELECTNKSVYVHGIDIDKTEIGKIIDSEIKEDGVYVTIKIKEKYKDKFKDLMKKTDLIEVTCYEDTKKGDHMDTSSGHIYNRDEIKIEDIKGDLISWQVGERVECKGCNFEVKEIRVFPEDEIVLKGIPKISIMELTDLAGRIKNLEMKYE